MTAFQAYMAGQFEHRAVGHIREVFPKDFAALGEPAVREWVRQGVEAAQRYGFEVEADVLRFIDLMFIFSRDFDRNPESSWAAPILRDEGREPKARMDALYDEARNHL